MNIIRFLKNLFRGLFNTSHTAICGTYIAPCGTVVTKLPARIEIPEGYEMAKFNDITGRFEYSDGTAPKHPNDLRKIK